MSVTEIRKKSDAKRFKKKYPIQRIRGELLNFIAKTLESPQELLSREIKLKKYIQIEIPFSVFLSKNKIGYGKFGYFKLRETCDLQDYITIVIKSEMKKKKIKFTTGKVWIDLVIQKPQVRGDAINYIDRICDAIQPAIGINDYWFSIKRLDWQVVYKDPKIIIGIGQDFNEKMKGCSMCGRVLLVNPYFFKTKGNIDKPYQNCRSCRSKDIKSIII